MIEIAVAALTAEQKAATGNSKWVGFTQLRRVLLFGARKNCFNGCTCDGGVLWITQFDLLSVANN